MREGVFHPAQLPPPDRKIYHAVRTGAAFLAAAKTYYEFELKDFLAWADPGLPEFAAAAIHILAKRLARAPDDPQAVFGAGGPLTGAEAHFGDARVVDALLRALAKRRLRLCLEAIQFGRLDLALARPDAFDNIALGRPAWQSSTSPRSRKRSLRREAEGGNDGDRETRLGCLTAQQENPWWAVDLGAEQAIRQVRIVNRPLAEQRLRNFVIETSPDFLRWTTAFAHDGADMRLLRARPIEIDFAPPVMARYLRVRLPRRGVLHLSEVEVMRA
jgi:hypothetical protein